MGGKTLFCGVHFRRRRRQRLLPAHMTWSLEEVTQPISCNLCAQEFGELQNVLCTCPRDASALSSSDDPSESACPASSTAKTQQATRKKWIRAQARGPSRETEWAQRSNDTASAVIHSHCPCAPSRSAGAEHVSLHLICFSTHGQRVTSTHTSLPPPPLLQPETGFTDWPQDHMHAHTVTHTLARARHRVQTHSTRCHILVHVSQCT